MSADAAIYRSERMAAAYAFTRPPVHPQIAARIGTALAPGPTVEAALDIGCGAGASTAALAPIARRVVGLEPYASMLAHAPTVAPHARFVIGRGEALPFTHGAFDLVTAAGALNYADVTSSLAEIARVMRDGGLFTPYDFSAGSRTREDDRLGHWHTAFCSHYPSPPGYALDLEALDYRAHGLELVRYESREVEIPMTLGQYVDYVMGESRVEDALAAGRHEDGIRRKCQDGLRSIFSDSSRLVVFETQMAYVRK